jgi:hypothetical protein
MSSSISLSWSHCHVVARNGGWSRLVNVPVEQAEKACTRLVELGASSASVIEPDIIQFKAGASVCSHLVSIFPCCPVA